jgi:hypothetical protein
MLPNSVSPVAKIISMSPWGLERFETLRLENLEENIRYILIGNNFLGFFFFGLGQ